MAPYCAIPRDYLSDTPLLRAMHGQLGAIPPPPFLSVSLGRACEVEVRYPPPPQKAYLSHTCAIPYENKANGCDTPSCDTIWTRCCAIWGGISHWAAKGTPHTTMLEDQGVAMGSWPRSPTNQVHPTRHFTNYSCYPKSQSIGLQELRKDPSVLKP